MRAARAPRRCAELVSAALLGAGLLTACSGMPPADPTSAAPTSAPTTPEPSTTTAPTATAPTADAPTTGSATSGTSAPEPLIESVVTIEVVGGASYEITPSAALRVRATPSRIEAAWQEVMRQLPESPSDGLRDQFVCHAYFAPRKPVWHIEPWRPEIGYLATVAAACNPGPVADPDRG